MKAVIAAVVLVAAGCGTIAGQKRNANRPPPGECPEGGCGTNGTRTAGTVDVTAPRVESVTLRGGSR